MLDSENNRIQICDVANSHRLILGKSGCGKTWLCCRMLETASEHHKNCLVFDYSGSYTCEELEKNKFSYMDQIQVIGEDKKKLAWCYNGDELYSAYYSALVKALHIRGRKQQCLLYEVIMNLSNDNAQVTIERIINELKQAEHLEDKERQKTAGKLLDYLEAYSDMNIMCQRKTASSREVDKCITIVQLFSYDTFQKSFLTNFLTELFWREIRERQSSVDYVLYDEFQCMPLGSGSTLEEMLREGRKYGLGVWLASQFLSEYSAAEIDTLMQADNLFLFRPTQSSLIRTAKLLNYTTKTWERILPKLDIGHFVFKGHFSVNGKAEIEEGAVICRV